MLKIAQAQPIKKQNPDSKIWTQETLLVSTGETLIHDLKGCLHDVIKLMN